MYRSLLDLMRSPPWPAPEAGPRLAPRWEEDARFLTLRFRTDGLDPRSIRVEVGPTAVAVSGCRTHTEQVEAAGYFRASSALSAVHRTFGLPCVVVPATAAMRWRADDELEVRLQKA